MKPVWVLILAAQLFNLHNLAKGHCTNRRLIVLGYAGEENCASVWSFSVASVVENDVNIDGDDHNSHNLHQDP